MVVLYLTANALYWFLELDQKLYSINSVNEDWDLHSHDCPDFGTYALGYKKKVPQSGPHVRTKGMSLLWQMIFLKLQVKLNNTINLVHTWPPVYIPLNFPINYAVFVCFMSSLFCAHTAIDSFTMRMLIL